MGYTQEIFEEARKKLYLRKVNAQQEFEKKQKILYSKSSRAAEIESELALTGIRAAKAVAKGGNAKLELLKLRERNEALRKELRCIINNFGFPDGYFKIKYFCPLCQDNGFIDGKMCKCMKELLRKECYNKLNESSALSLSSFGTFSLEYYSETPLKFGGASPKKRMSLILEYCKDYSKDFSKNSPSLLFTGNTGLGKTHLSLAIAREVINKGYGVLYTSAQSLVSKMEKEKFKSYTDISDVEGCFINCDLLIIDDLGTEFSTAFSSSCIYNIINSRIIKSKPTIISTNFTMKELEKTYAQSTVSRIIGNNIRLEFLGSDVRQKLLKKRLGRISESSELKKDI